MNPPPPTAPPQPGASTSARSRTRSTVTTANGETFTLNRQQLTTRQRSSPSATASPTWAGRESRSLMAALTESTLRMLTNTGTYPESANYPNDGSDGATTTPSACSRCARNRAGAPSQS